MAQLVHLNGAPGVGKSVVARRFLDDHPLALLVDIDALRTALGCWDELEESKVVARTLAVALIEEHLGHGHDVVVPQYLGRPEFVTVLERTALGCGATFVEVVLDAPPAIAAERFRNRRAGLRTRKVHHPEADVADDAVEAMIRESLARLEALRAGRDDAVLVDADQPVEETYADLIAALGAAGSQQEHADSDPPGSCKVQR